MKLTQYLVALLLLSFLAGGCATKTEKQNWGKIVQAGEATQLVESATVLPDHTYYFTGPEAIPDAVIAIDNRFTLQSKYWIKIDDVAEKLKDWNRYIDNAHSFESSNIRTRMMIRYGGFWIMTPDDKQAGLWYSRHDNTVIQFPDPSTIIIYAPVIPAADKKPLPTPTRE